MKTKLYKILIAVNFFFFVLGIILMGYGMIVYGNFSLDFLIR